MFNNEELHDYVVSYAKKVLEDDTLNEYQRYLAKNCIENQNCHIKGVAKEKRSDSAVTILNVDVAIPDEILETNCDIVCIKGLFCDLYDKLKNNYAHFYVIGDFPEKMVIASKYRLENTTFKNERFNFVIKNIKMDYCTTTTTNIVIGTLTIITETQIPIVLCTEWTDEFKAETSRDKDGNYSLTIEGKESCSWQDKSGREYSLKGAGEIHVDEKGKVSGEAIPNGIQKSVLG